MIKNSQPFGKKFQKTVGGGFFLTHTVHWWRGASRAPKTRVSRRRRRRAGYVSPSPHRTGLWVTARNFFTFPCWNGVFWGYFGCKF